jgi:outer membrane murein-binding lipoprotein Lpp
MFVLSIVLVGALMVVLAAILVDSPLGRSWARRLEGPAGDATATDVRELQRKVDLLEGEMDELRRALGGMREEVQFVNRLLEAPRNKDT